MRGKFCSIKLDAQERVNEIEKKRRRERAREREGEEEREIAGEGERERERVSERALLNRRFGWKQRAVHHTCNAASTARSYQRDRFSYPSSLLFPRPQYANVRDLMATSYMHARLYVTS